MFSLDWITPEELCPLSEAPLSLGAGFPNPHKHKAARRWPYPSQQSLKAPLSEHT